MATTFDKLAETNSWEYNHLKAIEELAELTEVLIKRVTKKDGTKEPKPQEVIDEIGDVIIRTNILAIMYGYNEVESRVMRKLEVFEDALAKGKHKGRI